MFFSAAIFHYCNFDSNWFLKIPKVFVFGKSWLTVKESWSEGSPDIAAIPDLCNETLGSQPTSGGDQVGNEATASGFTPN
jgi:hypothetical protein